MHTVRNRVASKPRNKGKMPPRGTRKKQEPAFMLKSGNPPAFPIGLIVPPPRGAMITAVPWPEAAAPKPRATTKSNTRRKAAPSKVRKTRTMIGDRPIWLQVDGGISMQTIEMALEAGADTFVVGSAVFNAPDPAQMVVDLRKFATRNS